MILLFFIIIFPFCKNNLQKCFKKPFLGHTAWIGEHAYSDFWQTLNAKLEPLARFCCNNTTYSLLVYSAFTHSGSDGRQRHKPGAKEKALATHRFMGYREVASSSNCLTPIRPVSMIQVITIILGQKTPVEKEKVTDSERNGQRNYYLIHYWWKYEQNYGKNIDFERKSKITEIKNCEFGVLLKWFLEGLQASPWNHQAAVRQLLMRSTH